MCSSSYYVIITQVQVKVGEFLSPLHAMAAPEHLDWDHDRIMAETTSSEDELLSSTTEGRRQITGDEISRLHYRPISEAEEAATWLIDVGLGNIVDNLMENNQLVTETSLANAVIEEGLTSNQFQTVRKRVETLRLTLKGRKTRTGAGRPDCRDIFRDPEVY